MKSRTIVTARFLLQLITVCLAALTQAAYCASTVKPDPATLALQYVESVTQATCNGGASEYLNIIFDTSDWKEQANVVVRLSNILSHWLTKNNHVLWNMTDEMIFAMTRTTIEIEKLTFGSAIAFEPGLYHNMSKFCAYSYNTYNNTIKSHDISVEYNYFPSEWYDGCKQKFLKTLGSLHRSVPSAQSSEESLVDHSSFTPHSIPIMCFPKVSTGRNNVSKLFTKLNPEVFGKTLLLL
ncbi:hypothetical protein RvY_13371-2 [Ramazzottius varieornatus]|uniref:Uncharacterized protein n=1 Tax=Ramazzottius varieornatus TaxID=947166 RepID=A0A1D1VSZ5_RAMVA|nr:hypothetical protein RvY_13371-2 [Ramazzottius varieornatus]